MAVRIIDGLKAVQVQIDQGQLLVVAQRVGHGLIEPVGEQYAVGQPGQGVVVCAPL